MKISPVRQEKINSIELYDYETIDSYHGWINMLFSKNRPDYWDYYGGYRTISKTFGGSTTGRYKTAPSPKG